MAEPSAKVRRIVELRGRLPYVSHTAFAAVCHVAQTEPLPIVSRSSVRKARDAVACQQTPYGPLMKTVSVTTTDGEPYMFWVVCPVALLWAAAQKHYFGRLLKRTFLRCPPSPARPWSMFLYNDEVTPGNPKKADNLKKMQVVYWSLKEFLADGLSKEDYWLTSTVLRSVECAKIDGGMSAIMAAVVKTFFSGEHNLLLAGVSVDACERGAAAQPMRLWLRWAGLVSDEAALHANWLCKGATGIKCCAMCLNILSHHWLAADEVGPDSWFKLYNTVFDVRDCVLHTKASILAIVDGLRAAKGILGVGAFKAKEVAVGWNHANHGLLYDPVVRPFVDPPAQTIYDWPHSTLQGVFPMQIHQLKLALKDSNIDLYALLDDYLKDWHVPAHAKTTGLDVFSARRRLHMKESKTFKASMSETLSVHAIINHWVQQIVAPTGLLPIHCEAFGHLSRLICMLQAAPRGFSVLTPDTLRTQIRRHLRALRLTNDGEGWIPKCHHQVHYPDVYRAFETIPHTVPLERKHKGVKLFAEALDNTHGAYDANILKEITCSCLTTLENSDHLNLNPGLRAPRKPAADIRGTLEASFGVRAFLVSSVARHDSSGYCSAGDIIAYKHGAGWTAGRISYFFSVDAVAAAMVVPLTEVKREVTYSMWTIPDDHCIAVRLEDVVEALTHRVAVNVVTALHPYVLQR